MTEFDVVVIGAGAGGLAAALTLSAAGKRVLVCEAGPRAGGKLGVAFHEGVEFDTGPSVLTMIDVLAELFEGAGTRLEDELELVRCEPFEYLWPDGTRLDVAFSPQTTGQNIAAAFGDEAAKEFELFLRYARGIWDAAAPNFVYGDAPTTFSAIKLGVTKFREVLKIDAMRSMAAAIEKQVSHPRLRDVLMRYATYNGSNPYAAPATLNCIAWVEMGLGAFGVRGGMHELAKALERVAMRHGAVFRYEAPVKRILTENGRVTGVELWGGSTVRAGAVVCNADVGHLVTSLLPQARGVSAPKDPSMSGWTAVVKARRRAERAPHLVLFPSRPYRGEFEDIFEKGCVPEEPTVYVCAQEKAHGRTGWTDHEPLFIMANAPAEPLDGETSAEVFERLEAVMMGRLQDAGLVEADDEIVWRRTPADLARQFVGSRGSIYGASSNSQFSAFQRPPNEVREVPGLFLASGSAHPGGGVPMCLLSGRAAARAISG
jgi:phytoene desaturase